MNRSDGAPRSSDDQPAPRGVDVTIECADGYRLSGRVFDPVGDQSDRTALIAPATGARASFYWRYAAFLAAAGIRAVVVDYRGIGRSAPPGSPGALRDITMRWHEWGTLDIDAVLGWAQESAPNHELAVVGHSFGGFATCLAPRAPAVSRLLMVGAQHAHWPDYAARHRAGMVWRWHIVMPALAAVLGYFPGSRLGWIDDLPRGVAFDWARGHRNFARTMGRAGSSAIARAANLTFDVLAVAPTDDPFATVSAMDRTLSYLPQARIERCRISPAAAGVEGIGHLGLFHDRFRDSLWPSSVDWLYAA